MAKTRGDGDPQEPTLELPSLFGRGRKRRREQPDEPLPDTPEPVEQTSPVAPVEEPAEPAPEPTPEPAPEPKRKATKATRPPKPPKPAKVPNPQRAARTGPVLPPGVAAIITGLLVGLAGTALTYVSLRGCEMLKGTESCGAPGLGLLVVILVLMMLGGALLLRLLGVSEPRGTSFLAIGLMCVIVLVTLMEDLFSVWMFVAVPLICAVTYALGHWVTTQFVETADDRPHVDVR
jgi:hypothetical protein